MADRPGTDGAPAIVIVEPHDDSREMFVMSLQWAGFTVLSAATGSAALRLAARRVPAAFVTCLRLPDMDAFAFCEALRAQMNRPGLPVVALSSCEPDYARAAGDGRFAAVLMKRCPTDDLLRCLRGLVAYR